MDKQSKFTKSLHWTTIASEKLLLAIIGIATCIASAMYIFDMVLAQEITLPDLFMLFIYVEIIGMVGAFYSTNRILQKHPNRISMASDGTVTYWMPDGFKLMIER